MKGLAAYVFCGWSRARFRGVQREKRTGTSSNGEDCINLCTFRFMRRCAVNCTQTRQWFKRTKLSDLEFTSLLRRLGFVVNTEANRDFH